ncbi:hypothetical protein [Arthrobacter sp. H5]|uniref:hypothetical protein n=1 Tax=Arthrobacter sp. H5 TaxID=1267973 RepID=UPI0004B3D0EA|nr:hypothetical protein [Arthrobacter sp. H5]
MSKSTMTRAAARPRAVTRDRTTTLLVAWRNPLYKAYLLIGSVVHFESPDGEYFEFSYRKDVAKKALFHRIPGFDQVDLVYRSSRLFHS